MTSALYTLNVLGHMAGATLPGQNRTKRRCFIRCRNISKGYIVIGLSKGVGTVCKYSFNDVKTLYDEMRQTEGKKAYKYISQVLEKAEGPYKEDFLKRNPQKNERSAGQSWNKFKGDCFERLLQHIITELVEPFGLKVVNGNDLKPNKLAPQLDAVKQEVIISYDDFGKYLPDADIVVYKPKNSEVIAVISSKTSLRERLTQTGYWKFKLQEGENRKYIKFYLVTLDYKALKKKKPARKARAIAEIDFNGTYVLSEENIEESDKVKLFEHFIDDLKQVIEENQ